MPMADVSRVRERDGDLMPSLTPVILCGGSGTRLWPLSRAEFPKQFINLAGKTSLLEETAKRAAGLEGSSRLICVAAIQHRRLMRETLRRVNIDGVLLLEPSSRNTAPAIAAAALLAFGQNP